MKNVWEMVRVQFLLNRASPDFTLIVLIIPEVLVVKVQHGILIWANIPVDVKFRIILITVIENTDHMAVTVSIEVFKEIS